LTESQYSSYSIQYRRSFDAISSLLKHRLDCLEAVLLVKDLAQLCLEFIPDFFYLPALKFEGIFEIDDITFDLTSVASL
jgi:hypothetical protein